MSETAQKLKAALELLGPNGEHWTQKAFARDVTGEQANSESKHATCWCLAGALSRVNLGYDRIRRFLPTGYDNLVTFNDMPERTFADVKAVFEKAIEANL